MKKYLRYVLIIFFIFTSSYAGSDGLNKLQKKDLKIFPVIESQALIISGNVSQGIFMRSYNHEDIINKALIYKVTMSSISLGRMIFCSRRP